MATLNADLSFTGSVGNFVAYTRRDLDKVILRTKGDGNTREKIKNSARFENTRHMNAEFGGRSAAVKWTRQMIWPMPQLADFNFAGSLNALIRHIQALDTTSKKGERGIAVTKGRSILQGFNLNKKNPFDTIVRNPLQFTLSQEGNTAHVDLPALIPGINFFVPGKYPLYSLIVALGFIPDFSYSAKGYEPSFDQFPSVGSQHVRTPWYASLEGSAATSLDIQLANNAVPFEVYSLVLSIGICFGTMDAINSVQQVKYAGAAKILGLL